MNHSIAMLLAGGQGSRLLTLSRHRAKPAVPFGGIYRIIDFTLSCIMRSNIPVVGILTQYRPYSLMDHVSNGEAWGFVGRRRLAKVLPPFQGDTRSDWYAGTADAIYQNLDFINRFPNADEILVLSGDHIYSMNYAEVIRQHREHDADLTVACQEVPWEETRQFGIMVTDDSGRIVQFMEKPQERPPSNLASLGIYVFKRRVLVERLLADAENKDSDHDFGNNIIPGMIADGRAYAYKFSGYWRDVGTVDSYWRAHMDILTPQTELDPNAWQTRTNAASLGYRNIFPARVDKDSQAQDSIIGLGAIVAGGLRRSILSPGVHVGHGAQVENSVILHNTVISDGAVVRNAVIDKDCVIGPGAVIGDGDDTPNQRQPDKLFTGLTLIGKGAQIPANMQVGKNCLINAGAQERHFPADGVTPSGATVS